MTAFSPADQTGDSEEFRCTHGPVDFLVPENVNLLHIDAYGAQGSDGGDKRNGPGGFGAHVTADVPVSNGQKLRVMTGCIADKTGDTFGFGRGGAGGPGNAGYYRLAGAPGGGGSGVIDRSIGEKFPPLVVAGGGGGGGGGMAGFSDRGGAGGDAGATAQNGKDGQGKGAGTGGAGGAESGPEGGKGGKSPEVGAGGGGGGGGYHGGSGGQAGVGGGRSGGPGGGGGAGDSYIVDGATKTSMTTSDRLGDGLITISWTPTSSA
ncbi:hypothetical protein [Streptomyces sp. 1222.5]|uniref:hypothetical protein n=1 Tax=Streptomyces sp. 1222.5 TaxID=1881026 RepID=UPI003EC03827